jgi:hypothetical protein
MSRRKYQPHQQLKTIRRTLQQTQKQFATEMLRVSYPYFLSVETGQRAMSESLARKIGWLVGVSSAGLLNNKNAKPMSFDDTSKKLVPFSLETYRQHCAQFPTFAAPDMHEEVTPSLEGYAKAFHVVLDSAMSMHRLGAVLSNFFKFFADSITSGASVGAFHASLQKLYPEDPEAAKAAVALIGRTYIKPYNSQSK